MWKRAVDKRDREKYKDGIMNSKNVRCNPQKVYPQIEERAYVDPTAVIIGNVQVGKNVFVGPAAVIRADEAGSSVIIHDNCNVQDRVIIHALEDSSVVIEENTSLAHACIIHGPCRIGKNCFIGFGSVVFQADIGNNVCVKHLAVVEGVDISPDKLIESHRLVNCEQDARELGYADKKQREFMEKVIHVNQYLTAKYKDA